MFTVNKNNLNNDNCHEIPFRKGKRKCESSSICEEQRSFPRPRHLDVEDYNKSLDEYNYEVLSFEESEKKMNQRPHYLLPQNQINNFLTRLSRKEKNQFFLEESINTKEMEITKVPNISPIHSFRDIGMSAIQYFKTGNYLLLDTKNEEVEVIYKNDKEEIISQILTKDINPFESYISKISPPLTNRIDHESLKYIFFEKTQQVLNQIIEKSCVKSFLLRPSNEGIGNMTLIFKDEKGNVTYHRYKKCSNDPQLPHLYYNDQGEQAALNQIIEKLKEKGCHYISPENIQSFSAEPELLPCDKKETEIQEILLYLNHVQNQPVRKLKLSEVIHQNMSAIQSEKFFSTQENKNCFLIRPSSLPSTVVISKKLDNKITHIRYLCVLDRHNETKYKYDTTHLKKESDELSPMSLVNIEKIESMELSLSQLFDIQILNNLSFIAPV